MALYRKPISELLSVTAVWDHTVLPATYPTQVNAPRLNPSKIA